jgi:hypothetical protein
MAWRKKGVPIPEESRYDRMDSENLYLMLESGLGTATHLVDTYRAMHDERDQTLALLETELEIALAATKALRRKLLVVP